MTQDNLKHIAADVKYEHALQLSNENVKKPVCLMHAGHLFFKLYNEFHKIAGLDNAIAAYETAVRLTPDGHQCQAELHGTLGQALVHRLDHSGNITDIENAIFTLECALILTPNGDVDRISLFNDLGTSFARRFERSGDLADCDKA